jgi:hypothetical protein
MTGQILSPRPDVNNEGIAIQDVAPANMKKTAGGRRSLKSSVEALACTRLACKLAFASTTYAANLFAGAYN